MKTSGWGQAADPHAAFWAHGLFLHDTIALISQALIKIQNKAGKEFFCRIRLDAGIADKWFCDRNMTAVTHRNPFLFRWPLIWWNRGGLGEMRKHGRLSMMIPGTAIPKLSILGWLGFPGRLDRVSQPWWDVTLPAQQARSHSCLISPLQPALPESSLGDFLCR